MSAPKLDEAAFPWQHIHARNAKVRAKTVRKPFAPPFSVDDMQAVAVALFGGCPTCKALLEVDGSCPFEREHEKHVCPDCGAESAERLSVARPCLFESEHGKAAE